MNIILIDDEQLALDYLEHHLMKIPYLKVIGKYTDASAGKQAILRSEVDLVFLDIQMPEIDGIELAEQLLEFKPDLNIVFVTAYDEYAVKAFEINALDYLLKPVGMDRLLKTLKRIQDLTAETETSRAGTEAKALHIQMFHQFAMRTDGQPHEPLRWRTSRAQELFLYLLQNKGQLVRKSTLIDMLWPDYEEDKALSQLYTAVYHVRKTLGYYSNHFTISSTNDGYILNVYNATLDVELWEQYLQSGLPIAQETIGEYEDKMGLYAGDYLNEYDYWWAESERQRLKLIWLRTMLRMAEWYAKNLKQDKAIERYMDICTRYPLTEEAHFALMKLYASRDKHLEVHKQYRTLEKLVMEELNEKPSLYITEWYLQWKLENKQ